MTGSGGAGNLPAALGNVPANIQIGINGTSTFVPTMQAFINEQNAYNAVIGEESLVAAYQDTVAVLPDPKVAMTAATILASHAQHLLILREDAGANALAAS